MSTIRTGTQSALVVVDVQNGVMAESWNTPGVVKKIAQAVERARDAHVPVIWVQHESDELPKNSDSWKLAPELVPRPEEARVHKKFPSSFEDTTLEEHLSRLGTTHIFLAGAQTNWCIRATAYAALDKGYDLTLLKDAHTTAHIELEDGSRVEASSMVADLNVTMTWLRYPGRKAETASAEGIDFHHRSATNK